MSEPLSRHSLFEALYSARRELMRSLLFLSEEEATTIPVHADWCVRDVISHITARECVALAAIQHLRRDGNPEFRTALDDRRFNLAAIERRRDFSLGEVQDELDGIRRELTKQARKLMKHELFAEFEIGTTGQMQSVGGLLMTLAEHDREHAVDLWRWRAANGVLHRDRFRWVITSNREDFMNALGGLFEDDLLGVEVCGHWTVAQVMAHLLSWDEETYRTAQNWTGDRSWQAEALYDDDWNEAEVAKRAHLSIIELADGLTTTHRQIVQLFDSLSDEELATTANAPWGEPMALISFLYEMAQHDAVHTPDLQALRNRLGI